MLANYRFGFVDNDVVIAAARLEPAIALAAASPLPAELDEALRDHEGGPSDDEGAFPDRVPLVVLAR